MISKLDDRTRSSNSGDTVTDSDQKTLGEAVVDSIQGTDEPVEKKHPWVPPALVFLSYPVVLIGGILMIITVMYFLKT